MSAASGPLLEARGVSHWFGVPGRGGVRALDDVSLQLWPGETLGLVGESGSGKSTLARALLRLLDAGSGQVLYRGQDLAALRARELRALRRKLQLVFQDPYASLNPRLRVGDTLGEVLAAHGLAAGRAARARRVGELLELVGLAREHAARFPHELSGGQRQRVGLARALAVEPECIVADEPLSALDVSVQAQVVNLLCELRERFSLSLLFISHDLDVVEYLCDRVAVLYLGRVLELAPTAELFARPRHPYTQALLAASPRPDPEQRLASAPLRGEIPSPSAPPSGCVFRTRCPHAAPVCATERPPLLELAPGHWAACLLHDKLATAAP